MASPVLPNLVISGGQTGADQGGLLGARDAGLRTGGTAPKGWRTEDGAAPWLAEFGLVEGRRASYSARTRANIEAADGTVIFGNHLSKGSALTERYCTELGKPLLRIPFGRAHADLEGAARQLADWLGHHAIKVLNVAGNRESGNPGIRDYVHQVILHSLTLLNQSRGN